MRPVVSIHRSGRSPSIGPSRKACTSPSIAVHRRLTRLVERPAHRRDGIVDQARRDALDTRLPGSPPAAPPRRCCGVPGRPRRRRPPAASACATRRYPRVSLSPSRQPSPRTVRSGPGSPGGRTGRDTPCLGRQPLGRQADPVPAPVRVARLRHEAAWCHHRAGRRWSLWTGIGFDHDAPQGQRQGPRQSRPPRHPARRSCARCHRRATPSAGTLSRAPCSGSPDRVPMPSRLGRPAGPRPVRRPAAAGRTGRRRHP
jgi:hypothetical protein